MDEEPGRRTVGPVSDGQAWVLIVEVGILALAALLGIARRP